MGIGGRGDVMTSGVPMILIASASSYERRYRLGKAPAARAPGLMQTETHTHGLAVSGRHPFGRSKCLVGGWIDGHRDAHGVGCGEGQRAAGARWAPALRAAPRGFRGRVQWTSLPVEVRR